MNPNKLVLPWLSAAITPLLVTFICPTAALATDYTWNGGAGDSNWTTGDNWGGTPPTPANTATVIFTGTIQPSTNNDFPNNSLFSGISFGNTNTGEAFTLTGNQITIAGAGTRSSANVSTGSITDAIDLGLRLNTNLLWGMGTNHHLTINGLVSDATATARSVAASQGAGTLTLTNAGNSYLGESAVYNAATLAVTSIANSTVPSAAGAGSTIRLGASGSGSGGVLVYTGSGDSSTDRTINLASSLNSTAKISNNGSGALVFTGPFTNGATATQTKTLQLGGTSTAANAIESDLSDDVNGG
ncbi:hypothetical protein, partial [Haloferula sp.]|uniref:hypothetical protein n=1 Tax=Haloferula sp. TaxID=2497595 RepID=UPI003C7409F1